MTARRLLLVALAGWAGLALGLALAGRPVLAMVGLWAGKTLALAAGWAISPRPTDADQA